MLLSPSARKGEKGGRSWYKGLGKRVLLLQLTLVKGVVLFELDLLNPLVRNLPRMMEVSGKIDIRDSWLI